MYLVADMGFHCLPFMGRNLENKKYLTPVRIMNSAGLIHKNIVNSVDIFNENDANKSNLRQLNWDEQCFLRIFLGRTIFHAHSAGSIAPPKFPS
jgi:hypothetical protein